MQRWAMQSNLMKGSCCPRDSTVRVPLTFSGFVIRRYLGKGGGRGEGRGRGRGDEQGKGCLHRIEEERSDQLH